MKLSFTTLGCPQWDLGTVISRAKQYGYDGVDFRGLGPALDVTVLPAFTTEASVTRRRFRDAGLEVSGISSSIQLCSAAKRAANLDEARRTVAVAQALDCANVRVFGGGEVTEATRAAAAQTGRECMEALLALDGARGLNWLFETHDSWIRGADCKLLLEALPDPAFGALWDTGHTWRVGGETAEQTFAAIGARVRYTHFKDAVRDPAMKDGWRYVLPGRGQLPIAEAVRVLRRGGYDGYLVFEHEKRWHADLPEPEEAFPAFAQWARGVLKE